MLRIAVVCVLLGFASAARTGQSVSPVQKVIELLEENKVKITNDLAAEEKEMKEYTDFCDKESSEKGYAIETATRTLEDLAATITDCESKIPALEDTVAELGSEVASKQKQLYEATDVRKKEKADFDDAEKELMTSIDQLTRAVTIIKRETAAGSFVQVSDSTKSRSQGLDLAMSVLSRIIDSGRINLGSGKSLEAFMQTDDEQPQAKEVAYESKSGGIIAKIEEMKEKAEETLTGSRNTEMKAQQDFAMLEQSLNDGIAVAMEKISNAKKSIGAKTEQLGQAKGDSQETQASKAADEKYLQELKHDCSEASANWAQRQESATAEMGAIDKAIQILSEGVRVLLQTKQTTSKRVSNNNLEKYDSEFDDASQGTESQEVSSDSLTRSRLVQKLKDMSHKFGSYALMEVAGSAAMDPFVKIRGLIEEMISKLVKEAQEEATQKAFCDEEMGKSNKAKEQKTNTLNKLQSRIDQASARKAELEQAVKDLESEIAALDASTAEATKIRNDENASNEKAIQDFGDAAAATEKAIKVLKDFYDNAFLLQTSATLRRTSQPELGGAKSDASSVIISILEMSNEDFTKLHSETVASEAEAAEAYEKLMNDNKASKGAKEAEVKGSLSEIKSLTVTLENNGEDHGMTSKELDAVLEYLEKLKPQCEEKAMSYAEKKARREAEIAGLKEALEILAGGVFMQVQSHTRALRGVHA